MRRAVDEEVTAVAAKQGQHMLRQQVLDCGGTDSLILRRVQSGDWERTWHPGLLRVAGKPDRHGDLWSLLLAAGPGARVSHLPAVALYRCDGLPEQLHPAVTVPARRKLALPDGWKVHVDRHLPRVDQAMVGRLPTVTPARAILDAAALLTADELEVVYESARTRRVLTDERLMRRLAAHRRPGRQGLRTLDTVLDRRDVEVKDSVMETMFVQLLRDLGLPRPVIHHRVLDAHGVFLAEVDVAYPDLRLYWELDSWRWHGQRDGFERDRARSNALLDNGTPAYRLTWRMLTVDRTATGRHIVAVYRRRAEAAAPPQATAARPAL